MRQRRRHSRINELGQEVLSSLPKAPPVGRSPVSGLRERVRDMIASERLAARMREEGFETFEEADDFEMEDGDDPMSPYEEVFEPEAREEDNLDSRLVDALEKLAGVGDQVVEPEAPEAPDTES